MPDLFVTNMNPRFTGVSATAANVIRQQIGSHDLRLVGHPLPGCPAPITVNEARRMSRNPGRAPCVLWHVRRNPEMRVAIWTRDVLRLPIRIVFTSAAQRRHSAYPRWLISRMDAVIATTDKAAEYVPNVRAVVPHGVDTDLFSPSEDRAAAWAALGYGGSMGLATVGRIRPEKGTDLFVEAMLRLLPDLEGATALILGRAAREHQSFLRDLKDKVAVAGMAGRILFPGEVPATELPAIMRSLSLIVQLPRYEGYGMVPLEAMASAVPFVASDAGYYRSFSKQGRCGTIVPQGNPQDVAGAALGILRSPDRHLEMARTARETATASFSARSEADGIEEVYRAVLNEASAGKS